jgi:hypothetical protein
MDPNEFGSAPVVQSNLRIFNMWSLKFSMNDLDSKVLKLVLFKRVLEMMPNNNPLKL